MALQPTTVKSIIDKAAYQFHTLETAVSTIESENPVYFPLVTQDDDYDFEHFMLPSVKAADTWDIAKITKDSPLKYIIGSLSSFFQSNENLSDVGVGGALDNYLYINNLTAYKYYADAQYYVNGYKMAGILVENTDVFVFAELGNDYGAAYFTSLGSYQTDDLNAPYGEYVEYTSFAPTSEVEILIVNGTINFDIHLICKDKNGDTFVFTQNISGSTGDRVKLNLTETIVGCSGLTEPYAGSDGDILRIQTIAPEV